MDTTSTTTGRLLDREEGPRAYAGLAGLHGMHPPIYAALAVEWQAQGRALPGRPDQRWAALTAPPVIGRQANVNSGTGMERWERVAVSQPAG